MKITDISIDTVLIILEHVSDNSKFIFRLTNKLFFEAVDDYEPFKIEEYAKTGNIDMIKWAYSCDCKLNKNVGIEAAGHGHIDILEWLLKTSRDFELSIRYDACHRAAECGQFEVVKWMKANIKNFVVRPELALNAAKGGHLDIVKWTMENGYNINYHIYCVQAAANNNMELLSELFYPMSPMSPTYVAMHEECMVHAANNGNMKMLVWLDEHNCHIDWEGKALRFAVVNGHLACVKWLVDKGYYNRWHRTDTYDACAAAAEGGHLKILKYLREKGFGWDEQVTIHASTHGHLKLLQWAIANRCNVNWHCQIAAAKGGHIHILDYIQEVDGSSIYCNFIADEAGKSGHIVVLDWLVAKGYNIDQWLRNVDQYAAEYDNVNVLIWLRSRSALNTRNPSMFSTAASNGNIRILKWLKVNGYSGNSYSFYRAAINGKLRALKWLAANGFQPDISVYMAASTGQIAVLKWLKDNESMLTSLSYKSSISPSRQFKWNNSVAVGIYLKAKAKNHINVVKWVMQYVIPTDIDRYEVVSHKCKFEDIVRQVSNIMNE